MSCTFVLLEAPLAFKSSATDGTNTGFGLRVFDCNVSVDIFLSNGNPTVKALNHIRNACNMEPITDHMEFCLLVENRHSQLVKSPSQ